MQKNSSTSKKSNLKPGCFMLYNTGKEPVTSTHGLLTTVAYQVFKIGLGIFAN